VRKAFVEALCDVATDERVVLLTGDLGYMALERFRDRHPRRFLNAGVAEQNMVGMATGLAEAGFLPFVYSIATFAALRPFEFIRNGPVHHRLPVRIVGTGMGFEYGHAGPSHHALEDFAALRTLPGLTIVVPADGAQAAAALRRTWEHPTPVYYSLGKDDRYVVPGLDGRFELGKLQILCAGTDLAIVTIGSVVAEVLGAVEVLATRGIRPTVALASGFCPDPVDDLTSLAAGHRCVVSVEAQAISGGLAALVGMVIASRRLPCRLVPLAVHDAPDGTSGSQPERWRKHGLSRDHIVEACRGIVESSA
jgi:transketolase